MSEVAKEILSNSRAKESEKKLISIKEIVNLIHIISFQNEF